MFVSNAMYFWMFVFLHIDIYIYIYIYQHCYTLILCWNFPKDLTLLSRIYDPASWTSIGAQNILDTSCSTSVRLPQFRDISLQYTSTVLYSTPLTLSQSLPTTQHVCLLPCRYVYLRYINVHISGSFLPVLWVVVANSTNWTWQRSESTNLLKWTVFTRHTNNSCKSATG